MTYKEEEMVNSGIEILTFVKPQIILQGPPGTGKTRLAIKIAKELTKAKNLGSPQNKIKEYLENFNPTTASIVEKRKEYKQLLDEFQTKFPKENLNDLSLEDYAFGNGANESFCWWLEYMLYDLGGYTGYAPKFLIFWKKDIEDYSKSGFLKDIESNELAMQKIAEQLYNVANNQNLDEAMKVMGKGFILKVLNSYYPDLYFPINNENCINNALKLLGIDYTGLNFIDKNRKLQEQFLTIKALSKSDITNIEFMKFMFSTFDMKGNILVQSNDILSQGEYNIIQFHPAYSYEDFVRGISAKSDNNQIEYIVENKIIAEIAQKALDNKSANFVLIIDEFNRANIPAVLGELIYALEYRFDETKPDETTVESMYALKAGPDDSVGSKTLKLPKNLFIIGTMNTADRSIGHIDYAIRRRFAFYSILPSSEVIDVEIKDEALKAKAKLLFASVAGLFVKDILAPDIEAKDVQLGHSYFLADSEVKLKLKLEYEIKPLLLEYLRDGIFLYGSEGDTVEQKIENLNV